MGLFNKFKKDGKKDEFRDVSVPKKIVETSDIKTGEEIKKEQLENELSSLRNELNEKNERLNSIIEKIQLSKNEYDGIVKKLIESKKELHTETNVMNDAMKDSSSDDLTGDINNSRIKLQKIQDEIIKNREINDQLEEKIKKNEPAFSDSENQKKKIDEELDQRQKELQVLMKRLTEMKKNGLKLQVSDDSKGVVEAASQIVATTNKRLHDTMKELDVTRQLLDKERRAHKETKKKL
tara:strand:- start:698 stop:1408 length:711 start_codon:yes stop_codon:yes gene_type:complete